MLRKKNIKLKKIDTIFTPTIFSVALIKAIFGIVTGRKSFDNNPDYFNDL
jgi:hypothetical protein